MNFMEEIAKLCDEFNNKIEELTKHIKEQEEEVNDKMPKGKIWKPAKDEEFFWISEYSTVCPAVNRDNLYVNAYPINRDNLYGNGNAYPIYRKAEFEANREKYTRLFRQYVEQHSEPLDWENGEQKKWYVYFDHIGKSVGFTWRCDCAEAGGIYASSKEVLQEAIEFVGEENFKKYILSVEE